jgi:hypothetical protein
MKVQAFRRIHCVLADGQTVDLLPGIRVDLPESVVERLLVKVPRHVEILDGADAFEPALDPALADPPILPGWMVAFFHEGEYQGGIRGGDTGLVCRVTFDGEHWNFFSAGGWHLTGPDVYQVWPIDRDGTVGESWYVKQQGLDGQGYQYCVTTARLVGRGSL